MTKTHLKNKPANTNNLMFDDMYYEIVNDDWRARAERLQSRRWHMLQRAMRKYHSDAIKEDLV